MANSMKSMTMMSLRTLDKTKKREVITGRFTSLLEEMSCTQECIVTRRHGHFVERVCVGEWKGRCSISAKRRRGEAQHLQRGGEPLNLKTQVKEQKKHQPKIWRMEERALGQNEEVIQSRKSFSNVVSV